MSRLAPENNKTNSIHGNTITNTIRGNIITDISSRGVEIVLDDDATHEYAPVSPWRKLWGIRHLRWLYYSYRLHLWLQFCAKNGLGYFPNRRDVDYLDKVWKGRL